MFCIHCGEPIADDSLFCPFCGKSTKQEMLKFCSYCGKSINMDSSFCPFCGKKIVNEKKSQPIYTLPHINKSLKEILKNQLLYMYVIWVIINSILLLKAQDAYSNYFNNSNVSPDHWSSSNKGIYPEDWLYPLKNIFSGIMGQDPVYVYDITEFALYVIALPIAFALLLLFRNKIFKTKKVEQIFYWTIVYITLWMIIVFPMGLFGLDYLGWSFVMSGLIIAVYAYNKTFSKLKAI